MNQTNPYSNENPSRIYGVTIVAAALAIGISTATWLGKAMLWPWITLAVIAIAGAITMHARYRPRRTVCCIVLSAFAIGGAWMVVRQQMVARNDLSAMVGDASALVRVRGVVLREPEMRSRAAGSMALFDYRVPATYFTMRLEALIDRAANVHPVRGEVLVRVDQTVPPMAPGDRIEATGLLHPPQGPRNPGEFDYRRFARSRGQVGVLVVQQRSLLRVTPRVGGDSPMQRLDGFRQALRRRASGWLLGHLPKTERTERDALLSALLLGQREPELDNLAESFRRVGLAHLLAISGLHLGVLAGLALLILRFSGRHRRYHGWIIITLVLLYLFLVETRMPVLRAGVMTIAACLGLVTGRRLVTASLVATSAIILLLYRPDDLFSPGFQLSFGVVLALLHLSPSVRRRWFGPPNRERASASAMLRECLKSAFVIAVTAWAVALPIVAYHFGEVAPLAAPLSILAVPVVAFVVAIGFTMILIAPVLPSLALVLGVPLVLGAAVLVALVHAVESLPGSVVSVHFPSVWWTVPAIAWACWWLGRESQRWKWSVRASGVVIIAWLFWPRHPIDETTAMRIDMLAVGDGSCYLLRTEDQTIVFDAGSTSDLDAGRRSIVPAMRRLDVRSIDALIISHPNIDHYSAVLELADTFDVGSVYVTEVLLQRAEADPMGPLAALLDGLNERNVPVVTVSGGVVRQFGHSTWTWLHPPPATAAAAVTGRGRVNDASMVIRIDVGRRRVLLCGDIQREAIAHLLGQGESIDADVMELPHHGSYSEIAETFVRTVNPQVVLQSTGGARLASDRWAAALGDRTRLVTARDGACHVIIRRDGTIRTGRFLESRP